jgi:hypothetical protein
MPIADPPVGLSDVENAAQRSFNDGKDAFRAALLQTVNAANALAEQTRNNFALLNQSANAVIVQELNGSDPTLAQAILAQRSAQAQPQTTGQLIGNAPHPSAT